MKRILSTILLVLVVLSLAASAWAAPIQVNCSNGGSISATIASLTQSGNTRGVTIFVRGTCHENVVISGFDHLVLQASPVATIQDASNGNAAVVTILASNDVELLNFNINGGSIGVNCATYSFCLLYLDTVQQSNGIGVRFGRSNGVLIGNKILNNVNGVSVLNGSKLSTDGDTISGNGVRGIAINSGSNVTASNDTIQNNNEAGIIVLQNSVLRAIDLTISNNGTDGVWLEAGSTASFEQAEVGNVITGNGANGVSVNDLSFASFIGTNNVSGNLTPPDVACYPQYSATRGAGTVGGTTNCNEPLNNQKQHSLQR